MMQTRSDIAYAVSRLTQFMINSAIDHWIALKRILRYLQSTKKLEVCYYSTKHLNIETWSDFSWSENFDDFKSINDHLAFMIEKLIAWKSFKQTSVALSSTEIEYVNQTLTCTQIMWIKSVLTEIDIKQVIFSELIIIFANNQRVIKLTENFVFQKRTKHIAIKYHYTRDLIKHEDVQLIYKTIDQMIVDELIKSLESILFKKFVASLDMTSVIEWSILCQSIKNDELVEHNHRHENRIAENTRHKEHDGDIVDLEEHIADHSDLEKHTADPAGLEGHTADHSDLERHTADLSDLGEHTADHSDLERHTADHSDHEKRSSTEKHLRKHNERRIEAHREHSVINERRIEIRERQSIIEEHRIDEHFDDHK